MSNSWKRFLALTLALVLSFGLAIPASAASMKTSAKKGNVTWTEIKDAEPALSVETVTPEKEKAPYADDDIVPVTIFLTGEPAINRYPVEDIGKNQGAVSYRESLKKTQNTVATRISKQALGGKKLVVESQLTLIANAIFAEVPYGKINAIKAVSGVKDVALQSFYRTDGFSTGTADPQMSTSSEMIGSSAAWAAGYTGAGSKVAIIDTGLTVNHISFDPDAFQYAIDSLDESVDLLTKDDISAVRSQLHVGSTTAAKLYYNAKVPFGYNYAGMGTEIGHHGGNDNSSEHGSHVAGIAAANRYINNGDGTFSPALSTVHTQGVAPDAQILVMKAFRNDGTTEQYYFPAIEDAITLGADAVNLSLGSRDAGVSSSDNASYQAVMDNLRNRGITVVVSMGNSGAWADESATGDLYQDAANYMTGGSPGSFTNSFTVASVDNYGFTGYYVTINGTDVFYTETADYRNAPMTTIGGATYDFVYVDGPGFLDSSHNDFASLNLTGKIALCNRGTSTFSDKANAAAARGAVGVIIVNNQPGTINMALTGYNYTAPCVSIQQSEGQLFKGNRTGTAASGAAIYTGSVYVGADIATTTGSLNAPFTMSDFSSWGTTGDLALKPEITAPGGNIYSVNGLTTNGYENMSGTSMAAPQITGMAAALGEYLRENNLEARTGKSERFLVQSLLSSTATPLKDETGNYYSILKQGAGLANIYKAVKAKSYIEMDPTATVSAADGKVKAELGDDPTRSGSYTVTFTLNNFSNRNNRYQFYGDFFTQDHFIGEDGLEYLDTATTEIPATVRFYANGHLLPASSASPAATRDLNGDGELTQDDVQVLLDYTVMTAAAFDAQYPNVTYTGFNTALADINGDGDVNSYDAKLLLDQYNSNTRTVYKLSVPAGQSVQVTADIQVNMPAEYDVKGAYIEGFLFAKEIAMIGSFIPVSLVQHSIPVLGYYGSWGEPGMFDHSTALDREYNAKTPYLANAFQNEDSLYSGGFFREESSNYIALKGNPYIADETYLPERNAIRSSDTIARAKVSLIRNAAATRVQIASGANVLFQRAAGAKAAAYYYQNESSASWQNTSCVESFAYGGSLSSLREGDPVTARFTAVPEYYVASDGSVDWAAVEAIPNSGMTMRYDMTVDNTAPTMLGGSAYYDGTTFRFPVSDNRYVAAVALVDPSTNAVIAQQGSDPAAALGATTSYSFALDAREYPLVIVQVYDYACNYSTYEVNPYGGPLASQRSELISERRSVEDVTPTAAPVLETVDDAEPIAPVTPITPVNPIGLDSFSSNIPGSTVPGTMFVKVTADERTGNGRYTMTYDPAKLRYVSTRFIGSDVISAISNDAATGTLTIAFAASDSYARGATILNVEFQKIGLANTSVTAVTNEINSNTGMSNSTTMQFKSVSAVSSVSIGVGNTYRLSPTVNAFPGTYTLRYTTNKSSVATVSSSGVITARKAGTALISVIATPTGGGAAGRCNVVVTVYDTATVGGGTTPLLPSVPTLP